MTQQFTATSQSQHRQPAQARQPTQGESYPVEGSIRQSEMQSTQPQSMGMQSTQPQPIQQQSAQPDSTGFESGGTIPKQPESGGTLPEQYRTALASVADAVEVCGWCADQCIQEADPTMIECIRLCEDVVELGETVLATVPRSSRFAADIVATFQQAAQVCAQECGRHRHAHCQECATVLGETLTASEQLIGAQSQRPR